MSIIGGGGDDNDVTPEITRVQHVRNPMHQIDVLNARLINIVNMIAKRKTALDEGWA